MAMQSLVLRPSLGGVIVSILQDGLAVTPGGSCEAWG